MSPFSPVEPLPDGMPVIHVSERDWELGKNYPTEMAIRADVKETLRALLPVLRAGVLASRRNRRRVDSTHRALATGRRSGKASA